MLDLHALYDGTGSTSLIQPATISAGDGAVVAGVPIITDPRKATLVGWGAMGIDATKAIKQASLSSNDLNDPANTSNWLPTGTSLAIASPCFIEALPYVTAARVVKAAQKAAGLEITYTIDHYEPASVRAACIGGAFAVPGRGIYSATFSGALTAQTWGTKALAPTYNMPAGRYAILGAWVSALTNLALLRFQHADFGAAQPGFPVADWFTSATTMTGISGDDIIGPGGQGYQFVKFSMLTGKPQCPVFKAGPNGTGLSIWAMSNTADTPTVAVNTVFLGA